MSAADTLAEFDRAWTDASDHHDADLAAAGADAALRARIDDNVFRHQANWADAQVAALDRTSPAITLALAEARTANDDVAAARAAADGVTTTVTRSAAAADALSRLLKKLS